MIRRSSRWLAAAGLAVLVPWAASAEVSIDTFSTPQTAEVVLEGPDFASSIVAAPEAIGGDRDVEVARLSGGGFVQFQTGAVGVEVLSCSAGAGTSGSCFVGWDGDDGTVDLDPSGLGGLDLTQEGANDAVALAVQADQPVTITIQVLQNGGGSLVEASLDLPGGDGDLVDRFLPISEFGPGAAAVFADAGAISLLITGPPAFDVLVDDVRVTVPEPAGAALAATAALAALARRRRKV